MKLAKSPSLLRHLVSFIKPSYLAYLLVVLCVGVHGAVLLRIPHVITHWNDSFWYLSQANFFLGGRYHHEASIQPSLNPNAFSTYMAPGYSGVIAIFVAIFGPSWQLALAIFQHLCFIGAKVILLRNAFFLASRNFLFDLVTKIVVLCFCFLPVTFVLPSTIMSESVAIAALALFLAFTWIGLRSEVRPFVFIFLSICTVALLLARGEKIVVCLAVGLAGFVVAWLDPNMRKRAIRSSTAIAVGVSVWLGLTLSFNYWQHGSAVLSTGTGRHLYNKFIGDLGLRPGAQTQLPCLAPQALPRFWWEGGAYPTALQCAQSEVLADDILKRIVMLALPQLTFKHILQGMMTPLEQALQKLKSDKLLDSELSGRHCCQGGVSAFEYISYTDQTYLDLEVPRLPELSFAASTIIYYCILGLPLLMPILLLVTRIDRALVFIGFVCIIGTCTKLFLEHIMARHLLDVDYVSLFWMSSWRAKWARERSIP